MRSTKDRERDERIEALAKEAALRVFAAAQPHGHGGRTLSLAAMAIEAGEAFALAWEARKPRR